jgi:hypothetical protein
MRYTTFLSYNYFTINVAVAVLTNSLIFIFIFFVTMNDSMIDWD